MIEPYGAVKEIHHYQTPTETYSIRKKFLSQGEITTMAKEMYGSLKYYEDRINSAELIVELVKEALSSRLQSGKVTSDELRLYADALDTVEDSVKYERSEYNKARERIGAVEAAATSAQASKDDEVTE